MTGGEIFVECLKAQGVTDIFGMPGGHLNPVYESLYKSREQITGIDLGNSTVSTNQWCP